MGYWLMAHEGEWNNCFSKIKLVGQEPFQEKNSHSILINEFSFKIQIWSCARCQTTMSNKQPINVIHANEVGGIQSFAVWTSERKVRQPAVQRM